MQRDIGKRLDNIASLDGIRAVAIALVFFAHGGLSEIVPGGLGVTIFFVLSGFLITTLMRIEYAQSGSLDLPAFYLRRFFRLFPPLLLVLLLALMLYAAGLSRVAPTAAGVASVLFFFGNYFAIFHEGMPNGLGVTWSLAVEEHFYIVFPMLGLVLLRYRRIVSLVSLGTLCVAVLVWRGWLVAHGASTARVNMGTDTRIDSILIGCAMALLCNPALDAVPLTARRHAGAICLAFLGVLVATLVFRGETFRQTFRYTVQSVAIAPLIYFSVAQSQHAAFRWLNTVPVAYLGKISYTVYLSHQVCLEFIHEHWPLLGTVPTIACMTLLVLAIAVPMRLWVEIPFARLRRRLHQRQRLVAGCTAS